MKMSCFQILWSLAHFHLSDFVNKKNCKIWVTESHRRKPVISTMFYSLVCVLGKWGHWPIRFWEWGWKCHNCKWWTLQGHDKRAKYKSANGHVYWFLAMYKINVSIEVVLMTKTFRTVRAAEHWKLATLVALMTYQELL